MRFEAVAFFGMRKALVETTFSVSIRIHLDTLHLRSEDGEERDLSFQSTKHKNHGHIVLSVDLLD